MAVKFEICGAERVEQLIAFIDCHWKKDHIFVRDRELFDWQHKSGNHYNFVLALQDEEIIAILGFIPTSQFSPALAVHRQAWLAIWKVREDVKYPGLGLLILKFLIKQYELATVCSLGLSQAVIPIYKALKYEVGQLNHYVFFHPSRTDFTLVTPPSNYQVPSLSVDFQIRKVVDLAGIQEAESLFDRQPMKDAIYILNRYIHHPRYCYQVLAVYKQSQVISLIVYREIIHNGTKLARIVDVQGESVLTEKYNSVIAQWLEREDLEYIDIVSNLEIEAGSGFRHNVDDNFVVPNYFEPFEMKNITIDYAYKSAIANVSIFRGDSDQDRPNL